MDAVKFLEETRRMCQAHNVCTGCPADSCGAVDCRVDFMKDIDAADAVAIVEKWSKENPIKTRNSEFLKRYPNARVQEDGTVELCPKWIDQNFDMGSIICHRTCCDRCKAEYWMQEVE